MLRAAMLSVIMLRVAMLSVIMVNVVMLHVIYFFNASLTIKFIYIRKEMFPE
jgi:hypothetical protein